jgi:hypothetical protein
MENIQQRAIKGINIFKKNIIVFLAICFVSSIISIYAVPFLINGSINEQEINDGISQVGMTYGGALTFSATEIINSLVFMLRLSILSTILVIIAYIVKQKIDKRIFKISSWRDWKFFLYVSGISLIIVDVFQKITTNNEGDLVLNLILTIVSCFVMVIFSSIILPEELKRIEI